MSEKKTRDFVDQTAKEYCKPTFNRDNFISQFTSDKLVCDY